ncbi:TPA: hypothetical protein ACH3X3_012853 [Trebouxia sp. C0006]
MRSLTVRASGCFPKTRHSAVKMQCTTRQDLSTLLPSSMPTSGSMTLAWVTQLPSWARYHHHHMMLLLGLHREIRLLQSLVCKAYLSMLRKVYGDELVLQPYVMSVDALNAEDTAGQHNARSHDVWSSKGPRHTSGP